MLVNLEDHIEIVMLPETSNDLLKSFIKLAKLIKVFEKIDFATDFSLGYLTVSPLNLGTALNISCKFETIYEF